MGRFLGAPHSVLISSSYTYHSIFCLFPTGRRSPTWRALLGDLWIFSSSWHTTTPHPQVAIVSVQVCSLLGSEGLCSIQTADMWDHWVRWLRDRLSHTFPALCPSINCRRNNPRINTIIPGRSHRPPLLYVNLRLENTLSLAYCIMGIYHQNSTLHRHVFNKRVCRIDYYIWDDQYRRERPRISYKTWNGIFVVSQFISRGSVFGGRSRNCSYRLFKSWNKSSLEKT